jgi:hypothetical protein
MMTIRDMEISLEDARFFNDKIQSIVRGPQQGHELDVIRRYFRAYLHCWKTILHFVREAKGLKEKAAWISWCSAWQAKHLDAFHIGVMKQLRETRDYDTHAGTIVLRGEVAGGLFPLVFMEAVKSSHVRRELVTVTGQGLEVVAQLLSTHVGFPQQPTARISSCDISQERARRG